MASDHLSYFMIAGAALGLFFAGNYTKFLLPILFIMMSFSLANIRLTKLSGHEKRSVFWLLFCAYVIQGGLMILLSSLFVHNIAFKQGLYLVAIMPPAAAIIPMAFMFKGDTKEALVAEIIGYGLALLFVPIFAYLLIGSSVSVFSVFKILLILIVGPFIFSRLIRKHKAIKSHVSKKIVKFSFFVMYFILFAVNRDSLLSGSMEVISIFLITIITLFITPTIIFFIAKRHDERINFVLFSALKNGSLAAGVAIPLLGSAASVPMTTRFFACLFFFAYFEWLIKKF